MTSDAPAYSPRSAYFAVAVEWPMLTTMPWARSACVSARQPGSSGAKVTMRASRNASGPHTSRASGNPRVGTLRCSGLWAPFLAGCMNGPSRCVPRQLAPSRPRASRRPSSGRTARYVSADDVITVPTKAVTPWAARPRATFLTAAGVRSGLL